MRDESGRIKEFLDQLTIEQGYEYADETPDEWLRTLQEMARAGINVAAPTLVVQQFISDRAKALSQKKSEKPNPGQERAGAVA